MSTYKLLKKIINLIKSGSRADNNPTQENGVSNGDNDASNGHAEDSVISPTPLNSVPYTVTPSVLEVTPPSAKRQKTNGTAKMSGDKAIREKISNEPIMIFYASRPAENVTKKILAAAKGGVMLSGSAALAKFGPLLGPMDIDQSEDEYFFRVSLPGVSTDRSTFSCVVKPSGKVQVKGVSVTGEKVVHKYSEVFEFQTQNLGPTGEFSIAFKLPGPVEKGTLSESVSDGILVGKIKKRASRVL